MNDFVKAQAKQMIAYVKAWEATCEFAAKKTDGIIDKEETKQLKRIHKAVEDFIKELERI